MRSIAALLIGAIALAWGTCAADVKVGDVPPDYLGQNFQDQAVSLSALKGKVVVVTFWASWCTYCRQEMSVLENVQKAAGHQALQVVAVNFKEDNETWKAMKRKLAGLNIEITRDKTWKVSEVYGVKALPNLFMIDKSGHVARRHVGYGKQALDVFVREINELLAQPP